MGALAARLGINDSARSLVDEEDGCQFNGMMMRMMMMMMMMMMGAIV